jgi:hypothetical protein
MKKRIAVVAATALVAAAGVATLASGIGMAAGVTAADLQARGWFCLPPAATPENVYHCFTPGKNTVALNVLVFDESGTRLLGTEHLIRADRYDDQPCQGTPEGRYAFVPLGPGYFACHHFDLGG